MRTITITAKAEIFNQYFCSVFTTVIPDDDGDERVVREAISDMDDTVIGGHEVESLLRGLKASKAGGPDGLSNRESERISARSLKDALYCFTENI